MTVDQYFDKVQDYMKEVLKDEELAKNIIVQPIGGTNQALTGIQKEIYDLVGDNARKGTSIKETADEIIKRYKNKAIINNDQKVNNLNQGMESEPNQLMGDRGTNQLEKKIMNFNEFINENR